MSLKVCVNQSLVDNPAELKFYSTFNIRVDIMYGIYWVGNKETTEPERFINIITKAPDKGVVYIR